MKNHPEIFVPKEKELYYFNEFLPQNPDIKNINFKKSENWYHKKFSFSEKTKIRGELTPIYLSSDSAPSKIFKYNPKIKLIVVLRDPVLRAHSQFLFNRQKGFELEKDFLQVLEKKKEIYVKESLYYEGISRYLNYFQKNQLLILDYQNLFENPKANLNEICRFLNVRFIPHRGINEVINKGRDAKFPFINQVIGQFNILTKRPAMKQIRELAKILKINVLAKSIINTNTQDRRGTGLNSLSYSTALEYFIKDIEKLENFLNKDLSEWKKN